MLNANVITVVKGGVCVDGGVLAGLWEDRRLNSPLKYRVQHFKSCRFTPQPQRAEFQPRAESEEMGKRSHVRRTGGGELQCLDSPSA